MPRDPEYVALILAATQGARLFPLTSEYPDGAPKHLLPISPLNPSAGEDAGGSDGTRGGGAPLLLRLLVRTYESGFDMAVVAVHKEDTSTVPFLTASGLCTPLGKEHASSVPTTGGGDGVADLEYRGVGSASSTKTDKAQSGRWMHVRVVHLPEDCNGSADALRFLSQGNTSIDSDEPPDSNCCYIPRTSHAVVMPGDLILEGALLSTTGGSDVLSLLVQAHRRWNAGGPSSSTAAACTMLLTDVGAEDKEGVPLKESSKAKMGLLSREEEDMEYIGLSSEVPPPLSASLASLSYSDEGGEPSRRVVLKRSKLEVEEDEGTGSTPKLSVAKRRLHSAGGNRGGRNGLANTMGGLSMAATATTDRSPTLSLRTDLSDVHVYVISNWVFELIHARPSMQSFQNEVLPLLISRQYRGVEAAFGPTAWKEEANRERLRKVLREMDGVSEEGRGVNCNSVSTLLGMYASGKTSGGLGRFVPDEEDENENPAEDMTGSSLLSPPSFPTSKHGYAVSAQVLSREVSALTLRACTLPSLLYGCGEVTSRTLKLDPAVSSSLVPTGAKLSTKFNSILLPGCSLGEKVQTKACSIGKNVTIGDRAKLNNCVVMNGVTIGSNTVLQNSVVGVGAEIGENCNLKDCQVGPGATVPATTRTTEKGETFEV
ncbi:hypothetical protein ACHAXT_009320 [Thalassiosira profunda]